jgi:hypothetical protein
VVRHVAGSTAPAESAARKAEEHRSARRAEVERMVKRAKESDEGTIEWTCWYLKQSAFLSDDPSRWPAQSKLDLFKVSRRQPLDGELTDTKAMRGAIKAVGEAEGEAAVAAAVAAVPVSSEPARRSEGNPSGDYARRDRAINGAALFLGRIGYSKTRNVATRDKESKEPIASIISKALDRLGVIMKERTINDILQLAGLRIADFNADGGVVTIRESKAGKPRHVVLTDEGQRFFAALTAGKLADDPVFARSDGGAWGKSHQLRPMLDACRRGMIEPAVSFHVLRHTHGSMLAMRGVPMGVIAQQLGHADTRMTEKHYAHLAPSYVAETIRAHFPVLGIANESSVTPIRPRGCSATVRH